MVVTDSKNLYDRLDRDSPTVKGEEKRPTIESLSLKDSTWETQMTLWWIHSDAQLANSLTKSTEKQQINLYYQLGQKWHIICDEQMKSARRRKAEGIGPLET